MNKQLNALTSTRFFAAILVVIHHFGRDAVPFKHARSFFSNGNLSVSYFFVLSGFILYYANNERQLNYREFVSKRAARILPMYYFALIIEVLLMLHGLIIAPGSGVYPVFWHELLYSSLLIQSCIPNYPLCLNLPAWSLSIEAFFYILFPLLLLFERKNFKFFLLFTTILFIVTQALHIYYFPEKNTLPSPKVDFLFFNPLMHVNQFLIGMLGGYFFKRHWEWFQGKKMLPALLVILILLCMAFRPAQISYQTGLLAPLFALAIMSIAAVNPRILQSRPLVILGNASYGIYILQYPLYQWADIFNHSYFPQPALFWIYLPCLVAISIIGYYLVEKPLRKKVTGWLLKDERNV
jgi:peptidoglycan/LPS O-acetylase OafA/YrhL